MMREQEKQNLMYLTVAGVGVSLAFFVLLKFTSHAQAQTPPPKSAATAPAAAPAAPASATTMLPPPPKAPQPAAAVQAPAPTPAAVPPTTGQVVEPSVAPPPPEATAAANADRKGDELSNLEGFLEPFIYDVVNRRDPFLPFAEFVPQDNGPQSRALTPAQRFDLDQLKLVGVMWDIKDPKALFMDPESEIFTLGRDEGIGNRNGYIASIREGEVVVVEAIRKRGDVVYKTRVLHLER